MTLESGHLMLFNVDVHSSTMNSANYLSEVPRTKLDRSVSSFVLRRRHGVSTGNDYAHQPSPRMKRRGAISYDVTDASAMYIRYLGMRSLRTPVSLSSFLSLSPSLPLSLPPSLSPPALSPLPPALSPLLPSPFSFPSPISLFVIVCM